ncbi:MAG: recombinase family protein [Planctomycetota bacterium]
MGAGGKPSRSAIYTRIFPRSDIRVLHLAASKQAAVLRERAGVMRCELLGEYHDTSKSHPEKLIEVVAAIGRDGVLFVYDTDRLGGADQAAVWQRVLADRRIRIEFYRDDPGPSRKVSRILDEYAATRSRVQRAVRGLEPAEAAHRSTVPWHDSEEGIDIVDRVLEMRQANLTPTQIAEELNHAGVPARSATGWTRHSVNNILRRQG